MEKVVSPEVLCVDFDNVFLFSVDFDSLVTLIVLLTCCWLPCVAKLCEGVGLGSFLLALSPNSGKSKGMLSMEVFEHKDPIK